MEEGLQAAYDGLMRVLRNPKASDTALSSASRTMLEAGGVLKAPEDGGEKEPHEMIANELQAKIAVLRAESLERSRPVIEVEPRRIEHADKTKGVFD